MLLFEGEPALFILFALFILSFLIGGCMWGSGEDENDQAKLTMGIVIFFFGVTCCIIFFILFIYKKVRQRRREKRDFEELMRMQNEFAANEGIDLVPMNFWTFLLLYSELFAKIFN
ncbi:hypothetical protein ECG_05167 [Echinococcus granulosus]|uniref:Glutamate receptor NMDA n=1 Tax=Echinococcus granulosus TaxID=6210 RepID=A0A068WK47_ECHGR|nr:hypothetical protein ECG_05167 [Echinococcus granulosus]CDS18063.1 glutamate receptor NMDA [Echinococcus granulosus]